MLRRPAVLPLVVATIVLMTAVLVVGSKALSAPTTSHSATATLDSSGPPILITAHSCAPGWAAPKAGRVVFHIANRTGDSGMIYLFNPYFGVTVARAAVAPDAAQDLAVRLKAGRYKWSCILRGRPTVISAVQAVLQAPVFGPAGPMYMMPVYSSQMAPAVAAYRAYVTSELALESSQVQQLRAAIGGGQIATARAAWLTAHLTWHRIGGAYDAFGDLGLAIDGTAARLQTGISSPQFTGFHKVELDLWQTDDLTAAAADTATLLMTSTSWPLQFPHESIPATELPLRTHEILEDALARRVEWLRRLRQRDRHGLGGGRRGRHPGTALAPGPRARAPGPRSGGHRWCPADPARRRLGRHPGERAVGGGDPGAAGPREQVDGDIGAALETLDLAPELLQVVGSTT